jgi:DNA-binding MarR family transcriptional regulator
MSEESLLLKEIQQRRPFASRQQEAFLNLLRTAAVLGAAMDRWFKELGLTRTQYNALRILRGAHPGALACSEVGERMVTPVPDVTRLLDRLEAVGLVTRCRDSHDRRVVNVAISDRGLARLAELDEPLEEKLRELLAPLGDADLATLVGLLERARDGKA